MTVSEDFLNYAGYQFVRQLPTGVWVGIRPMLYTTGLFVGLDETGYVSRYCYEHFRDAVTDCLSWTGVGDPPGQWIKHKPSNRMNPNWLNQAKQEISE
jgi:hypothetical protein